MPQIDRRINCYFSETLSTLPCGKRWNHSAKKLTFPLTPFLFFLPFLSFLFFYFHAGSARLSAWFAVGVIKQLTGWYLRPLSEKKQKPSFFFLFCVLDFLP